MECLSQHRSQLTWELSYTDSGPCHYQPQKLCCSIRHQLSPDFEGLFYIYNKAVFSSVSSSFLMESFTSEDTLTPELPASQVFKASLHHIITVLLYNPHNHLLFHTSVPPIDGPTVGKTVFTNNEGQMKLSNLKVISSTIAVCGHFQSRISKGTTLWPCTPAWVLTFPPTPPAGHPAR